MKPRLLPSGMYNVQVSYTDPETKKRVYQSFTSTRSGAEGKREVLKMAADWNADRKKRQRNTGVTLDAALDRYIESCRHSKTRTYSENTLSCYESIRANSFPELSDRLVDKLTVRDIQNQLDLLSDTHAEKTVKNAWLLLRPTLQLVRPSLDISDIHVRHIETLPDQDGDGDQIEIPGIDETMRLLSAAKEENESTYLALVFATFFGLRRSEIVALTWRDVDFEKNVVHVTKAYAKTRTNEWVLKGPKSKAGKRDISIPDAVAPILRQYRALGNIFSFTPDALTRRFQHLRDRLGMPYHLHCLRHYYCSTLLALNVPMNYIRASMGHSTNTMIDRVYGHMLKDKQQQVDSKYNQLISQIIAGEERSALSL